MYNAAENVTSERDSSRAVAENVMTLVVTLAADVAADEETDEEAVVAAAEKNVVTLIVLSFF